MADEHQLSLDDELKKAQIEKIRAEVKAVSLVPRIEFTKLFASLIVGLLSISFAIYQYQDAQSAKTAEQLAKKAEKTVENQLNEKTQESNELKESFNLQKSKPELAQARLVYVQFQGDTSRGFINELRKSLQKDSFNAPGGERIAGNYTSMVKYFPGSNKENNSDRADAEHLAKAVESFFESNGCRLTLPVISVSTNKQSPLEVWLAAKDSCKK